MWQKHVFYLTLLAKIQKGIVQAREARQWLKTARGKTKPSAAIFYKHVKKLSR